MTQAGTEAGEGMALGEATKALPWWAFGISLILTALPVLLSSWMPSWDYSMHATRASIIVRQSLPLFRDTFHYNLVPLPNLAVDLVVPFLSQILPVSLANKLFVLAALLLQATGGAALTIAVQRRLTPASLLIPLACYNIVVGWGFTGYLFSIGIGLWGSATYMMLRERTLALRVGVLSVFSIATYFGHLAAFGLMLVSVLTLEVVKFLGAKTRDSKPLRLAWLTVMLSAIVPVFVHVFLSPVGESVGFSLAAPVLWLTDLIMALNPYRTLGFSVLSICVVSFIAVLFAKRILKVDRTLGWTSLFLLFVYLLTPHELYGSWYANTRLIPWVLLVFLASIRPRRPDRNIALVVGAGCSALLIAQTGLILGLWLPWDAARRELMTAARTAPPGTMFVSLEQSGPVPPRRNFLESVGKAILQDDRDWQPPTSHITDEVAIYGEYLPIQFTLLPGKQPLEYDSKFWNLYLRFNSSYLNDIAAVDQEHYNSMSPTRRKHLMADLAFAPLQVNWRTVVGVRRLLVSADAEYRAIRKTSGVYPGAGTYVVYIHRWSADPPNPYPDIFREVYAGKLYNVYEVVTGGAGR